MNGPMIAAKAQLNIELQTAMHSFYTQQQLLRVLTIAILSVRLSVHLSHG